MWVCGCCTCVCSLGRCMLLCSMCALPISRLFRSSGTIGIAVVTWEVTPADSNTFVVNSGQTVFENGQEVADIVIEVSGEYVHM